MALDSIMHIRLDSELKKNSEELFESLGMDILTAIRMFLVQAVKCRGIPFQITQTVEDNKINLTDGEQED